MDNRTLLEQKLELEYKTFCRRLLSREKDYILENLEKAHIMKCLYRSMMDQCGNWSEEELQVFLIFPGLLEHLYRKWERTESNLSVEIGRCARKESIKLASAYRECLDAAGREMAG